MRRLVALVLIFIFILVGCSNPAPDKDIFQAKQEDNISDTTDSSGNISSGLPTTPADIHVTPSDITEDTGGIIDATPFDIPVYPSPLDAKLGEEYSGTQQVIMVSVDNESTTVCSIAVYGKENGQWVLVDSCKGYVGYKGCVDGAERMQSTNKTPLGIYRITAAFGIADDPGALYPYTKITEGMYWDLNSGSDTYNRLVYTDPNGDRELLWKMGAQYNYVLNTSYNEEQVIGKGGAIFIHCSKNEPTAGCVSMPEENMLKLICWVDPAKNPVMLSCLTEDIPSIN